MADENSNQALSPGHPLNGERVLRIPPSSTIKNSDMIKIYDRLVRIATWNVRSLFVSGKLANVEAEMNRMNIDILGMSEVRWPNSGQQKTSRGTIYFSGGTDPNHRYGVAILVSSEIAKSVIDFIPLSDRVMIIKIKTSYRTLNIIQAYAPTNDKSDEDVESFYNKLDEACTLTKKGEITVIMGDYNAKVGCGAEGDTVGKYGLGKRNSRGDRLVQFCVENNLFVSNTFFKLHPRHLYTWKSPADKKEKIVRNQIDFIMMDQRDKKYVKSAKTYPGADVNSDHNPVVMTLRIRRFSTIKRQTPTKKIDIRKLTDGHVKEQVGSSLEEKAKQIVEIEQSEVETTWRMIKDAITDVQENSVGFVKHNKKQEWITSEILEMMDQRRKLKYDKPKYKEINKIIRRKCREAKEQWLSEKCDEIEALQEKHDSFNVHKKVKELTGKNRKQITAILKDENNRIITGIEDKLKKWKEYIQTLFNDDRQSLLIDEDGLARSDLRITRSEVICAIKKQKNGKCTGPDGIYCEILKIIAEQEGAGLSLLINLFNAIYNSGKIPLDWLKSTFVTLPKKSNS